MPRNERPKRLRPNLQRSDDADEIGVNAGLGPASLGHPRIGERNAAGGCSISRKNVSDRSNERIFEADTREEANRKADEWWAKAKGVRFIHRCQTPAGFR